MSSTDASAVTNPYTRSRFLRVIGVVALIAAGLSLLPVLLVGPYPFYLFFAIAMLGPFTFLLMFDNAATGAPLILIICLLLFAYLIKPTRDTFTISVLGAIIWAVSGCVAAFLGNA
jgi:hypothetical protein